MRAAATRHTRALALAAGLALLGSDPCGPIPGSALEGPVASEPVADWSFVDAHRHCQLEVNPPEPHSVTTYCFAGEDAVYVPAVFGESKKWTKMALADPNARIRIDGTIYPVHITRIVDPDELLEVARLAHRRLHDGEEPPADFEVPEDRWYFRLTSR